jgi:hypothetical protein
MDANTTATSDSGASADADAVRVDGAGALFDGGGGAGGMVTTDSGAAGGSGPCGGLVCEDFESGSIDPAKWDTVAKGGTLAVQQQRVAHGKYAVQLHGQTGPSDWALLVAKNPPAALKGTTTFGRAYFFLAPEATASNHIQMAFAGRNGTAAVNGPAPFPKLHYVEYAVHHGTWQLGFDLLDVSPLVEDVSFTTNTVPTGAWSCLEWEFEDRPDRVTVWLEGMKVATFDNTNVGYAHPGPIPKPGGPLYNGMSSDIIGGFEILGVGFHDWGPQKPFDLYYDDIVLDSKRVGCLP